MFNGSNRLLINNIPALRHHQFKVNMSQDYEFLNVAQDNTELIMYIKEMLIESAKESHHKPLESPIVINKDLLLVMKLLNNKVIDHTAFYLN